MTSFGLYSRKLTLVALFLFGLVYTYHEISHRLDNDFGWQLRFGQETIANSFPYRDTYTWTYANRPWINHEWGTSIIWWLIYSRLGYFGIPALVAIVAWLSFALIPLVFKQKISILTLLASLLAVRADVFYLAPRPTILVVGFFVLLCLTLERIPEKKWFYAWPALFWCWAAIHGSWILGFIIILIYLFGNGLQTLLARRYSFFTASAWRQKHYAQTLAVALVSFLVIGLNPYTYQIWSEVGMYFTHTYYQQFITEWMSSLVYPVYWLSLLISTIALVLAAHAFLHKRLLTPQLLLFIALFIAGLQHKRNLTFTLLVAIPLLSGYAMLVTTSLKKTFQSSKIFPQNPRLNNALWGLLLILLSFHTGRFLISSRFDTTLWTERNFFAAYGFPVAAVEALNQMPFTKPLYIFNEFHWGGYLVWNLPQHRLYIDGRGTVSWSLDPPTSLYEEYRRLRFGQDGLSKLEATPATTILIYKKYLGIPKPDVWNRWSFSAVYLDKLTQPKPSELENDLRLSKRWTLIYEDYLAEIWQKSTSTVSHD